jgi:hypothetical protein
MVDQPPLGLARMRTSFDRVPVHIPASTRFLPGVLVLPFFVQRIPEMIIPYSDAAALMLANLTPGGEMARRRVGVALPDGMRGRKAQWAAKPNAASPRSTVAPSRSEGCRHRDILRHREIS